MFIHILVMILILSTVIVIQKCGVVLVFHAYLFTILNIVAVIIVIVVITIIP